MTLGLGLRLMRNDHKGPVIRLMIADAGKGSNPGLSIYEMDVDDAVWLRNNLSDLLKEVAEDGSK